jgi:fused signal recognition particle receptor
MDPWIALAAAAVVAVAAVLLLVVRWRRARRDPGARPGAAAVPGPAPDALTGKAGAAERLWRGLSATRQRLAGQLDGVLGRGGRSRDQILGELEEVLIGSDVGVATTAALLEPLRGLGRDVSGEQMRATLADTMRSILAGPPPQEPAGQPWVILVTGINGVGKTTTIGKLAAVHAAAGFSARASGRGRRSGCRERQLAVWAERTGSELIRHEPGPIRRPWSPARAAVARRVDSF